ncbi:hypothetical protein [Micromonospora sp. CB01531]|uniref:hypothetical protein n=1 Tax=Micromonospora sp. CB01531 TaxID=1718947 RepID=UPI000940310C|nr:hypothetical protein [Micromonospora sp. CB01531]OKI52839.1 hypothetical protein A6A27_08070 [Micromonospora sp. CB01531]
MTTTHLIRGHVPADSPLRQLAGRTVTLPAKSLQQLAERVREMRRAGIQPIVMAAPRPWPWTRIAFALTGAVLAATITALVAILTGHHSTAWVAAGAMVLLGIALFPVLTHQEMDA